jgi:hypothetical protein
MYTAAFAFLEARRYSKSEDEQKLKSIGYWVNIIEAMSCAALSIVLMLGNLSVTTLPMAFFYAFFDQLAGPCLLTTLIVALIMTEATRAMKEGDATRPLWRHYKWRISAVALLCPLPLVFVFYEAMACYSTAANYPNFTAEVSYLWIACLAGASLQSAFYFMMHAHRYRGLVSTYLFSEGPMTLDERDLSARDHAEWRLGYLVFWLNVSGVMTLANMFFNFVLLNLYGGLSLSAEPTASSIMQCCIFAVYTRLGISAAQVKAVLLDPTAKNIHLLGLSGLCFLGFSSHNKSASVQPQLELSNLRELPNNGYFESENISSGGGVKMTLEETVSPRFSNWNINVGHHSPIAPLYV